MLMNPLKLLVNKNHVLTQEQPEKSISIELLSVKIKYKKNDGII
jgi:hypothetical protein